MTVRMYSSLDAGAPALPNLASQRLIDNLRIILRACLVDGYGSKPGAGWTVVHDVADGFSLSNGEGVINFVHSASSVVVVYLMDAVTDGTTAFAGGVNRRSGPWFDGETTTVRQFLPSSMFGTATSKSWALVADSKTVTLLIQQGVAVVDPALSTSISGLHFGKYFPVLGGSGFAALGGSFNAFSPQALFSPAGAGAVPGTVLRNPFTGLITQGAAPGFAPAAGSALTRGHTGFQHAPFQHRVVQMLRAGVSALGVGLTGSTNLNTMAYCGALRGIMFDPFMGSARLAQVLGALGVATPHPDDRLRLVTIGASQFWPLFPSSGDVGSFVSLNPGDWEPLWT